MDGRTGAGASVGLGPAGLGSAGGECRGRARAAILFGLSTVILLSAGAGPARAVHTTGRRPKLAIYACMTGGLSDAQRDTLAKYDMAIVSVSPNEVSDLRKRNPKIELLFQWLPQNFFGLSENDSTWYPDTTWSLIRLTQFYAMQNNWYLRDIWGNRIPEWAGWAANWTRYCPKGVYGTSRGLNYVEWLSQVAMPQVVTSGRFWAPWGPGSGAYDGMHIEVTVDCVGSFSDSAYKYADPDGDGIAEGCDSGCSTGGDQDSLSVLYREMNDVFHPALDKLMDQGVLVILNIGNKYQGPAWRTDVTSNKLEGWMSWYDNQPWETWWDWFYGRKNPQHTEMWGPGYRWAQTFVHHTGNQAVEGWNHTILEVMPLPGWADTTCLRVRRWGLGTCLLGDGYFTYTLDQCSVHWYPEFDQDFGNPDGSFYKQMVGQLNGGDTLYVRDFDRGTVVVNPNGHPVGGVAAKDAQFTIYTVGRFATLQPALDESIRTTQPQLTWSTAYAPVQFPPDTVRYVVYWSVKPNFSNPDSAVAGTDTSFVFPPSTLQVQTNYYWRVRAEDLRGPARWSSPSTGWSFYIIDAETPCRISPQAAVLDDGILISWNMADASGVSGIRVYRRTPDSDWQAISPLLMVNGSAGRFLDSEASPGIPYDYSIEAFGPTGSAGRFGPISAEIPVPRDLTLRLEPNPGNGQASMAFTLPRSGNVTLRVIDVQGRVVEQIPLGFFLAGTHQKTLMLRDGTGRPLPAGPYLVRIQAPGGRKTVRWVVLR